VATDAADRPWAQVHGECDQGDGKPQNIYSLWVPEIHSNQAIVECFNHTLAERLFGHQYAVEMLASGRLPGSKGYPMLLPFSTMKSLI